jgi:ribosome maturation factor RimP
MEIQINETVSEIERLIDPILKEKSLELVDLEYKSEGKGKVVRVFIDKQGGVNVDDCSAVSRELSILLDVHDVIQSSYNLEISSPGLTRQLKKPEDFRKSIGKKLKLKLASPINKQYVLRNVILNGFVDNTISIEYEGKNYDITLNNLVKANLELDF